MVELGIVLGLDALLSWRRMVKELLKLVGTTSLDELIMRQR